MGNWVKFYTALRDKMTKERGVGGVGRTGANLPVTQVADMLYMLALVYEDVIRAIVTANHGEDVAYPGASGAPSVEGPGLLDSALAFVGGGATGGAAAAAARAARIDVRTWVVHGRRIDGYPLARAVEASPEAIGSGASWMQGTLTAAGVQGVTVPYHLYPGRLAQEQPAMIGNIMDRWDTCVRFAAERITLLAVAPTLKGANLSEWWSHFYNLLVAVEVVIESPPPSTMQLIAGATVFAAVKAGKAVQELTVGASHVAGQIAGELANTAGQVAGNAFSGFLGQVGLVGIMAVAVAILVASKYL